MRAIFVLLLLSGLLFAGQWEQTAGPEGGYVSSVEVYGNKLLTVSNHGYVFARENSEWSAIGKLNDSGQLLAFNDGLYFFEYYGVFKSIDGGSAWTELDFEGSPQLLFEEAGELFAVVGDTIYTTSDGENWSNPLLSMEAMTMLFGEPTIQKLVDIRSVGKTDSTFELGTTTSVYPLPKGVYTTSDNGENWTFAEGLPEPAYTNGMVNTSEGLYLTATKGVYFSSDGGFNWVERNEGIPTSNNYYNVNNLVEYDGQIYIRNSYDEMIYSYNQGNWSPVGNGITSTYFTIREDMIYYYDEGKLYSFNLNTSVSSDISEGLIATTPFVTAFGADRLFATEYSADWVTFDGGDTWEKMTDINIIEAVYDDGIINVLGEDGLYRSIDMGMSWQIAGSGVPSDYKSYGRTIVADKSTGVVYSGFNRMIPRTHLPPSWAAGGVYKSSNSGSSWVKVSTGLPMQGTVSVPVYTLMANDDLVIARTYEGLYRSTNGGSSWQLFENGIPQYTTFNFFAYYSERITAFSYDGIYYVDKQSASWEDMSDGLPTGLFDYYSHMRLFNIDDALYLYVHRDDTNYLYSFNGQTWELADQGFADNMKFLEFSYEDGYLFAGAFSNGVWKKQIDSGNQISLSSQYDEGWNLVSVPVNSSDMTVSGLFPGSSGMAFAFNGGYFSADMLENGTGYWLKFSQNSGVSFTGTEAQENIQLSEGWNLIGVHHEALGSSVITTEPADIIVSEFFSYDNGYGIANTLMPGEGYWVRSSSAGIINLNSRTAVPATGKVSKLPSLLFTDAAGNRSQLYFSENPEGLKSSLPPAPPEGAFDIRFAGDKFIASIDDNAHTVSLEGIVYPLSVSGSGIDVIINGATLREGEEIVINNSAGSELTVETLSDNLPSDYSLAQNYPNPFNPSTTINFTLPESGAVKLSVINILGEIVSVPVNSKIEAGNYSMNIDLSGFPSGVYFYRLESGKFSQVKKMMLLR